MQEVVSTTAAARRGCLQWVQAERAAWLSEVRDLTREVGKRAETKLCPCFHQLRSWGVSSIQHTVYTYDLEWPGPHTGSASDVVEICY
jgi:hypothetical protein